MDKRDKKNAGFSLTELVIVISILAILVGMIVPSYLSYVEKARRSVDMENAKNIETVLRLALVTDEIKIPEEKRSYNYGAWVMICHDGRAYAPTPYHNKNFNGIWCGADVGVTVGDETSTNEWNYNEKLEQILRDAGISSDSFRTYSNGNKDGWDWIIIEVGYSKEGQIFSRIYSGYKNQDGGINKTSTTNIEKLMYGE